MKTIIRNTVILLTCASPAYAANPNGEGGSFLLVLFLAFLAMIIWCQLLPAFKLFIDMLKGLTAEDRKEVEKRIHS